MKTSNFPLRATALAGLFRHPALATLALAATLAGCVANPPKPETATVATAVKTPAAKTFTNFTPALRCMDDMLLAYGKRDIVITTAGIPDSTGKVMAGTKEMLITAASKMSIKSKALTFIDYDTEQSDLLLLFQDIQAAGAFNHKLPNYYIRGAVTQLDENAIDSQQGAGVALPFLDMGVSRDQVSSVVSIDMNVGETTSRMILAGINASNSLVITRQGQGGDMGGRVGKLGFSFNVSLNRSEGLGAGVRALIELGMIELVGKLTGTPYWKCLEIDKTNPTMIEQARDWYDGMEQAELIKLIQRKLTGMNLFSGPINGKTSRELSSAIGKFQAENDLIADGRINFDLYYALLDADQPIAGDPAAQFAAPVATAAAATAVRPAAARPDASTGSKTLTAKLESDRGPHPVYKVGDFLQARAQLSFDGILYCYYRDNSGSIARIFPNRFHPDPFVRAGHPLTLPPEGSPFKIRFDRPGKEQIACFASERDLPLPANLKGVDLMPLKIGSLEEIAVGFRKSNPSIAEAKLEITVR